MLITLKRASDSPRPCKVYLNVSSSSISNVIVTSLLIHGTALDPGNGLIIDWLSSQDQYTKNALLVEIAGKTGTFSQELATKFPTLSCEVQDSAPELLARGKQLIESDPSSDLAERVHFRSRDLMGPRTIEELPAKDGPITFLIRSVVWNMSDAAVTELLQSFIPCLERRQAGGPAPCLLICDLVSPAFGTFESHVEKAFRRRDVTLMTMHNVQQRTSKEWGNLISKVDPRFKVSYIF